MHAGRGLPNLIGWPNKPDVLPPHGRDNRIVRTIIMRIGLTGGIAAGKSAAADYLRTLGAFVIDYDALARRIVSPGGAALPAIVREFGKKALNSDGTLNRSWIAEQVFGRDAKPGMRERLDGIEHPLIYEEARKEEQCAAANGISREPLIVHDVPLLAEVIDTIPFTFDHILTVEAPEEDRIARMIVTRNMTREQAEDRIRHQSSRAEREAIADAVVDSSGDIEQTRQQIDRRIRQWISEAEE